jgi:hypothetical protein
MDLTQIQIATLERFLQAGFRFVTLERMERYLGVAKDGFVTLLDPSDGRLVQFGQAGYLLPEGLGMLVERRAGKAFVWKSKSVAATPELLAGYKRFRSEVQVLLKG